MSYNNFSYFNGPSTPNQWWAPNNPNKPNFEQSRAPATVKQPATNPWSKTIITSEFNNQTFNQAPTQGFAQSMILPSENRPAETTTPHFEVMQGTVTQVFANFGYIDDCIIFSKTDVMGPMVQVGDKVGVDATYQPNNPTKYKGERVYKIDEARFNSVVNPNSSKMKTLTKGFDMQMRTRDTRDSSPRTESSIKSRLDYKYDSRELSPRMESSIKSRLEYKYDNRELSPRMESSIKSRLDYKYDKRDLSPRSDYKYETKRSSPRNDSSIKSRLDYKYETSKRSEQGLNSSKWINETKSKPRFANLKERMIDKARRKELFLERQREAKKALELSRKTETVKRKAISPIKFRLSSPNEVSTTKRKSESKTKSSRIYENFSYRELDCAAVKNIYRSLTLPKEFFHISLKYQTSFPLNHPMKLGNSCYFKVLDKKVKSVDPFIDEQLQKVVDPSDADTTFVAKVILLSTDDLAKFYKDTLTLAEEFDGDNKLPITKAIKFLVASVGAGKEFAIGGAWSPSLDGPDPDNNPRVLINTAIRTCKAMTGIDLSNCSSWPKFLELHYYRPMKKIQKRNEPDSNGNGETITIDLDEKEDPLEYHEPRMETVVYYIPDVWNCMPSSENWTEITRLYQEQLTTIMCPPPTLSVTPAMIITSNKSMSPAKPDSPCSSTGNAADQVMTSSTTDNNEGKDEQRLDTMSIEEGGATADQEEEDWNFNEAEEVDDKNKNSDPSITTGTITDEAQPTHYSKLIVTGMKIVDIKKELDLRKLNSRGVMEQLKARLKAVLEREESEDKNKESPSPVAPVVLTKLIPKSNLNEEEKNDLKKCYAFRNRPEIIVHQNRKIFGNQMKMRTMSLHSLLSYHNAPLHENTFELAIFAKQFLEMLRRDAVFNIYKSIVVADEAQLNSNDVSAKKAKLMVTTSKRTINRPLLFSFTLLDREKMNKISLEELKVFIEGLGICLSSDQLMSVLGKVKDTAKYLHYRQLTDKEMTDSDIANMLSLGDSEDLDYIKELAMGNKALFESDVPATYELMNDNDEMERLKNELDKSERCRQTIELKVAEMKDETEKNINLVQVYMKEIIKLKEQAIEYRMKYHSEQDRSEFYKRDFERMLRYMRDVDQMSLDLNKFVAEGLQKYAVDTKKVSTKEVTASVQVQDSRSKSEKSNNDDEPSLVDIMEEEENHVTIETSNDADMPQTTDVVDDPECVIVPDQREEIVPPVDPGVKVTKVAVHPSSEDFDLSKPSDYDMIIIDETE